jgi:hypothetical protein
MGRATTGDGTRNDELNGLVAGYLSTIEFTPAQYHPEAMLEYAKAVVEIVEDYEAAKRHPLLAANMDEDPPSRAFLGEPVCGNPNCGCH